MGRDQKIRVFTEQIAKKSRKYFGFLFDLFFPVGCLGCGEADVWLCQRCLEERLTIELTRVYLPYCPSLDELWHVADFNDALVGRLVRSAKYQGLKDISLIIGALLAREVNSLPEFRETWQAATVVPAPLYPYRLRMRGFNQAEVMAGVFALEAGLGRENYLLKVKNTKPQAGLTGEARRQNLAGSFRFNRKFSTVAENIILLDDVLTTGATFEEAAKILKQTGAKKVIGLAFAHGL